VGSGIPNNPDTGSIPFQIATARLAIAPCDVAAAQELAQLMTDARVYVPYRVSRPCAAQAEPDVAMWTQEPDDWLNRSRMNLAVHLRATNTVIGVVQFTPVQLAYFVHPDYWQLGYGTEMVGSACEVVPGLLRIPTLNAYVIRENLGSRNILAQAGFVFKGLAPRAWRAGHGTVTMLHYALRVPSA